MSALLRAASGTAVLAVSSCIPAVMFTMSTTLEPWLIVLVLLANAVAYSAFLAVYAKADRKRAAAYTALGSTIIPLAAALLSGDLTVPVLIGWPCTYVLAWSVARGRSIGVLGVIGASLVTGLGYFCMFVFIIGSALSDDPMTTTVTGAAVISSVTALAANGVLRMEVAVRESIRAA
ncbi:hypothetical protein L5G28_12000 [Gordonia sp. HY285]|uniref:hypothetical protein n=1 Tax=Gordonia liuliyuniae TaxID=2911517 RepID=UPI001F25FEB9|nr:hypothetical protein [Gordonia liuliyuniae]MCF8610870.1 hypothetical protein [Gordonia liuliyuniae]